MSIALIVLDVDGTMTDGKIIYSEQREEIKSFCVKDGLAIASWIRLGKEVAIITGRNSKIVERRAKELGIKHFYQGIKNKREILERILDELNLGMESVAAIGDDLNDSSMLKSVGIAFAPRNASKYITKIVDRVLDKDGGDGAVREMIEQLIVDEKLEEEYLALWDYE
jgi:3-deoxy-D-manno-octulosonate 8-phosphate phosphatase (KDO 8-P phosphatase)